MDNSISKNDIKDSFEIITQIFSDPPFMMFLKVLIIYLFVVVYYLIIQKCK